MFVFYILTYYGKPPVPEPSFLFKLHGKETSVQLFSCEFLRNFWKHYLIEHLRVTAYVGHGVRL